MNKHISERMKGIWKALMAYYEGGNLISSTSKGMEREFFISQFLSQVFSPDYRFNNGDIVDENEESSGQVDIVLEFPSFPSIPLYGSNPRMFMAEGVAAAVEIKSNLRSQWNEIELKTKLLKKLKRNFDGIVWMETSEKPMKDIPIIIIGYRGWKNSKTMQKKAHKASIDLIIDIEHDTYATPSENGNSGLNFLIQYIYGLTCHVPTGKLVAMQKYWGK